MTMKLVYLLNLVIGMMIQPTQPTQWSSTPPPVTNSSLSSVTIWDILSDAVVDDDDIDEEDDDYNDVDDNDDDDDVGL